MNPITFRDHERLEETPRRDAPAPQTIGGTGTALVGASGTKTYTVEITDNYHTAKIAGS
jgi:hypothetical protein